MVDEINLEFTYAVTDDPVSLTVVIGNGQMGGSSVRLDGAIVGKPGAIKNLRLGKGSDLIGHQLVVKTLVSDVNDLTNWTSVTYQLTGGPPQSPVTVQHRVANTGDGVLYRTSFRFQRAEVT